MKKFDVINYVIFIVSTIAIIYALIFDPNYIVVYAIALICIPLSVLSFGFISMARGKKSDEEEKISEPFIGY